MKLIKTMENEIVKICKVHGELNISNFYINYRKDKKTFRYRCKICCKIYANKNRERYNELSNNYRFNNKIKVRENEKKSYIKNREKILIRNRIRREKNKHIINEKKRLEIKELSDSYLRKLFVGSSKILKSINAPYEFIKTKRIYLKLKRKLKEIKGNENNNVEELREFISRDLERVSSGEITPAVANASANLSGKILQSVKLELEYNHAAGLSPNISFLGGIVNKTNKLIEKK